MKKITICGSAKYKNQFEYWNRKLSLEQNIVYTTCYTMKDMSDEEKKILDKINLKKIDYSDEIFVLDIDGYVGKSTQQKILYAKKHGKKVKLLSEWVKENNKKEILVYYTEGNIMDVIFVDEIPKCISWRGLAFNVHASGGYDALLITNDPSDHPKNYEGPYFIYYDD